ncbi:hypothetical protein M1D51_19945 [Arthrobacter sp. R3-55]|jgi:hypothetical protein|uniref:hypothetical protein n=1 Tax=Paenarthrobacter sp. CM16 TaxID=2738447 RepID=UPI001C12EB23|nr:hypothetical protein [Paenarthrobacter sp. CM16]
MNTSDKHDDATRRHTDAPAEGQPEGWVPQDTGRHSQDPAEGADTDDADAPSSDAS